MPDDLADYVVENKMRPTFRRLYHAYLVAAGIPALLLLLFIVGSLTLAGGQFGADDHRRWGSLVDAPVFSVPGWLVLGLAVVAGLVVVPVVVLVRLEWTGALVGLMRVTFAALAANLVFGGLFRGPDGWGLYLWGLAIYVSCVVVLFARIVQTNRASTQLLRSGRLSDLDDY